MGPVAEWAEKIVFFEIPWTGIPFVLVLLVVSALFFTIHFGFINVRGLKRAVRTVSGRYSKKSDPGEITHFQALSSALSATVGLGNIAGVAIAITVGGPGATFWMILCGVLGMTTKFCECTLGTRYREIDENGKVHGGAMFYLQKGFAELGWAKLGKTLAVVFAGACVMASLGAGNMFQGNQAFEQVLAITGGADSFFFGKGWLFGLIMAAFVAAVILGGIQSIGKVTSKLVPIMCFIYLTAASYVLFVHSDKIGYAFGLILSEAFSFKAGIGGMIGVMIQGLKRAAFSNEAGFGSAPIAHSAVKTTKPASEGYVALLEPLVDTVIVCTMTALVIIITGAQTDGGDWAQAITVTSNAFGSVISWFPYVLFAAVLLFAFSTMISWCYYGEQAWGYLFGKTRRNAFIYKMLFSCVVILGCSIELGNVLKFSDAMLFLMCFPNFIGIYVLLPKIKEELKIFDKHADAIDAAKK